jgi:S-adenosylmethionine synthetase
MMSSQILTSESVTEGHPDKIADQMSDAVLDAALLADPQARVACEVLVTTGLVLVAGEITTTAVIDIPAVIRATLRAIGYTDATYGIDSESCGVLVALNQQSPDIARGVEMGGAGDQGMMFGYATDELASTGAAGLSPAGAAEGLGVAPDELEWAALDSGSYMPAPIVFANRLVWRLSNLRRTDPRFHWLRPDGKAQVSVEYEDGRPRRIATVVLSAQHAPEITLEEVRTEIIRHVITPLLPPELFDIDSALLHINPTGRFVIGGPHGDTGLTGRKLMVDTYGGAARHGGGSFSGKDPSKVDRSGAYGARWAAKHVVAAGLARCCEVAVAYAIGVAEPVAVQVNTFGTALLPEEQINRAVRQVFDFRPRALSEQLRLTAPIYRPTAVHGHFGRTPFTATVGGRAHAFFTWEVLDRLDELRVAAGL